MGDKEAGMFWAGVLMMWLFGSFAIGISLHLFWGKSHDEAFALVAPWSALTACAVLLCIAIGFIVLAISDSRREQG